MVNGLLLTLFVITKDPDSGARDIDIRRAQIKGRDKTGIVFGAPDRYGAIHHSKWMARIGQRDPAD